MKTSILTIRTPEGIIFSQSLAGPVVRFFAWFIDQACIHAAMSVMGLLVGLLGILSFNLSIALYFIASFVV